MKQKPLIDEDGVPSGDDGQQKTPGGYPVDEVSSALQKSIRRGLEEDALYWCAEFYKARPNGIWKRLRVIASEDVGIASRKERLSRMHFRTTGAYERPGCIEKQPGFARFWTRLQAASQAG